MRLFVCYMRLAVTFLFLYGYSRAAHSRQRPIVTRSRESRYDRSITTFDPSGRLLQVEYSHAASERGAQILALVLENNKIIFQAPMSNVYRLDHHLWLVTTGLSGDSRALANHLRSNSRQHRLDYGERMSVNECATTGADLHHKLTYTEGTRPMGCAALVLGLDNNNELRIFRIDSGGGLKDSWFAAMGNGSEKAMSSLNKEYDKMKQSVESTVTGMIKMSGKESKEHCIWVLRPNLQTRGEVKMSCFQNTRTNKSARMISKQLEE